MSDAATLPALASIPRRHACGKKVQPTKAQRKAARRAERTKPSLAMVRRSEIVNAAEILSELWKNEFVRTFQYEAGRLYALRRAQQYGHACPSAVKLPTASTPEEKAREYLDDAEREERDQHIARSYQAADRRLRDCGAAAHANVFQICVEASAPAWLILWVQAILAMKAGNLAPYITFALSPAMDERDAFVEGLNALALEFGLADKAMIEEADDARSDVSRVDALAA